jgi:hypothetical protein
MSVLGEVGIKLGYTLRGAHGDCDGDRIQSPVLGTGGELCGGRGDTCLEGVSAAKKGALVV